MNPWVLAMSMPLAPIVLIVGGIAVALVVLVRSLKSVRVRAYQIEGTVTRLDQTSREMSVEFVSPRTGKRVELTGVVPLDCPVGGEDGLAEFGAIRCGDRVRVAADWDRRLKVATPRSVEIVTEPDEALGSKPESPAVAAIETV